MGLGSLGSPSHKSGQQEVPRQGANLTGPFTRPRGPGCFFFEANTPGKWMTCAKSAKQVPSGNQHHSKSKRTWLVLLMGSRPQKQGFKALRFRKSIQHNPGSSSQCQYHPCDHHTSIHFVPRCLIISLVNHKQREPWPAVALRPLQQMSTDSHHWICTMLTHFPVLISHQASPIHQPRKQTRTCCHG